MFTIHGVTLPDNFMPVMFHGTSEADMAHILRKGIEPRGDKDANHLDHPSRPDCVYMAGVNGFSPRYAIHRGQKMKSRAVVLELDLNQLDLNLILPDEDYISSEVPKIDGESDADHHLRIRDNLPLYKELSKKSMLRGAFAYHGTVPSKAITRAVVFDINQSGVFYHYWLDERWQRLPFKFNTETYPLVLINMFDGKITVGSLLEKAISHAATAEEREQIKESFERETITIISAAEAKSRWGSDE